jgi:xylan 1,4-beta-xylosidase
VNGAAITVDCSQPRPLPRLWASVGCDEINWIYTPTGRHLLELLSAGRHETFHVRTHYVFCSGTGRSLPHWGAGNVYHEDASGRPYYDWSVVDRLYDAVTGAGHVPLVELGFTPRALVPDGAGERFPYAPSPTQYSAYEAGLWSFPPRSFERWGELVEALVAHCVERYGAASVERWLWELWNEPDISYWRGTAEEYFRLYEVTASAVRSALPAGKVGGPATTGDLRGGGPDFLRAFLRHCAERDVPLDFASFHTKGAAFTPWRQYGPIGSPAPVQQSPSTVKMLREVRDALDAVGAHDRFRALPCVVDECDASVPAHWGVYDNANFAYRNHEYYAVFQCQLMAKLLRLGEEAGIRPAQATTWSFYMEGERCFEGTRGLLTSHDIEKPVLNAYRMLSRLGTWELPVTSTARWDVARVEVDGAVPEEIDALASMDDDGRVAVLVWRHQDDQHHPDAELSAVDLRIAGIPYERGEVRVRHWRIDAAHSNAHTVWKALGGPDYPGPEEVAAIRARQGLERLEPDRRERVDNAALALRLTLPLPAVSLVELERLDAQP